MPIENKSLIIFTDLWKPAGYLLVNALEKLVEEARFDGHEVHIFEPSFCPIAIPIPPLFELSAGFTTQGSLERIIMEHGFDGIFIPTPDGPIGTQARAACEAVGARYCTGDSYLDEATIRIKFRTEKAHTIAMHRSSAAIITFGDMEPDERFLGSPLAKKLVNIYQYGHWPKSPEEYRRAYELFYDEVFR